MTGDDKLGLSRFDGPTGSKFMWEDGDFEVSDGDPDDRPEVKLSGKITKVDPDRRLAYGWFSVVEVSGDPVVDVQGDVIKAATLVDAVHKFMTDSRAGKVLHRGERVADVVESLVFTADVQKALGIDLGRVGWFGALKFRDGEVWDRVKSGELRAFSIGGVGKRAAI